MMNAKLSLVTLLSLLFFVSVSYGNVLIVGPGGAYNTIQSAVDAANDGDVILVKPASTPYKGFTINNKSLYIVGDGSPGAIVSINEAIKVYNLQANKFLVLSNMTMDPDPVTFGFPPNQHEAITLNTNFGSIRIMDCHLIGNDGEHVNNTACYPKPAVIAIQSKDVCFARCFIRGGHGLESLGTMYAYSAGKQGVYANSCSIALYDCTIIGGDGGATSAIGSTGAEGADGYYDFGTGFLFASGCGFVGGDGGDAMQVGGDAGHGVHLSPSAQAKMLDCSYQGGVGGFGIVYPGKNGQPIYGGDVFKRKGAARFFTTPGLVREKKKFDLELKGELGDLTALCTSPMPGGMYAHDLKGQWLLSLFHPVTLLVLGPVNNAGELVFNISIPDLGASFDAFPLEMQSVFRASNGEVILGPSQSLVVLEEIY